MSRFSSAPSHSHVRGRPHRRRLAWWAALLFLGAFLTFGLVNTVQAAQAGLAGKRQLLAAERELSDRRINPAREQLLAAQSSFGRMDRELRALGPLLPVARVIPLVRLQVRGVEAFSAAGILVSRAGLQLTEATSGLLARDDRETRIAHALQELKAVRESVGSGVDALDVAAERVRALAGYRLVGPLASARSDLTRDLDRFSRRAASAESGLDALIVFAGGSGPRRYLLFSQNPDEVRPSGGFLGTYGVVRAAPDGIAIERYEDTGKWRNAHPEAVVPEEQLASPFRHYPTVDQSISNVNAVADWPTSSKLAMQLWEQGGENPVDGVLAVTPAFLSRILGVLGPVEVPSFGETVTRQNLIDRFNFYTRQSEEATELGRLKKEFVADLATAVLEKLLAAPAGRWVDLGAAIGSSFDLREAVAWSRDEVVNAALASRRWDGSLPETGGDFFYDAEFEYAAKNGRALRRVFDHHVQLDEKGDALITTTITINNTDGPRPFNASATIYHTLYGPVGATLDGSSDPPASLEAPLRGHPAAGWFRAAPPKGSSRLKVAWRAPGVARRLPDGSWVYGLWFMRLPDHSGDVLNLRVDLPPGWEWEDNPPPARTNLEADLVDAWRYSGGR